MSSSVAEQISVQPEAVSRRANASSVQHPLAKEYLEALESLAQELDLASTAIVGRTLPRLEESVSRQLAICSRLGSLSDKLYRHHSPEVPLISSLDASLAERISLATKHLGTLNKRYSALVKHSTETVRLFAGLFRGYTGPMEQGSASRSDLRTWSCEL